MKLDPIHRSILRVLEFAQEPLTMTEVIVRIPYVDRTVLGNWTLPFERLAKAGYVVTDGLMYKI